MVSAGSEETLQTYVDEALEHLASMEHDLLAMERARTDRDDELTHRVFRAAHSIKGGAGFVGLTNIKDLSHRMESVLGRIRDRELEPSAEIINVLLATTDILRDLIGSARVSNERDISRYLAVLDSVGERPRSGEPPPDETFGLGTVSISFPDGSAAFRVSEETLSRVRGEGKILYLILLPPEQEDRPQGKKAQDLAREMEPYGIVLGIHPQQARQGSPGEVSGGAGGPVSVLLACMLEPGDLASLVGVDLERVLEVAEDFTARPPAPEPPRLLDLRGKEATAPRPVERPDLGAPAKEGRDGGSGKEEPAPNARTQTDGTLRVPVRLLDSLMTLAGELVLGRNQLLQALGSGDLRRLQAAGQRMDLITSNLQEAVTRTRMQPVGNIFNRFPRVVRELARALDKEVVLSQEGSDVEMDKTIIEAIGDPLTHLVRNAVDHGIEPPAERREAGKDPEGRIRLTARHEAGHVHVEISDDGRGLDPEKLTAAALAKGFINEERARTLSEREKMNLIFLPGFSLSDRVSDLSGRGVGMDVVKSNLDGLGGVIEIDSTLGSGTRVRIKLPLTLAILPCQMVRSGGERYALPRVNVEELFRIPTRQVEQRVELVGTAQVIRLRGRLLPLVRLSEVLCGKQSGVPSDATREDPGDAPTTRGGSPAGLNIVVISTGISRYGLVVDELLDSEEIVVKPLGRHLKPCDGYAGATILGDGRVALILDAHQLARMAKLSFSEKAGNGEASPEENESTAQEACLDTLLVFHGAEGERFAVPLKEVERMERVRWEKIREVSGRKTVFSRGATLPLFSLDEAAHVKPLAPTAHSLVLVFSLAGREAGLLATEPVDTVQVPLQQREEMFRQPGIHGSILIGETPTLLVDMADLVRTLCPGWFASPGTTGTPGENGETILLVEDSAFFRNQVRDTLAERGYRVLEAEDGEIAWERIREEGDEISLVVTDIEMPNLDGFGLALRIRQDPNVSRLPVIALTSLAQEEDVARGRAAGMDDYQIKLDKEKLLASIDGILKKREAAPPVLREPDPHHPAVLPARKRQGKNNDREGRKES